MNGSIESARPRSLISTAAPITQTSSVAVSKRTGMSVRMRSIACSRFTPSTPSREPVMPTSLMNAVPSGQHPAVGGRHMGVGTEHRRDSAVEVPAERDLLAGHLGVEVDHDRVGPVGQARRAEGRLRRRRIRAALSPTVPLRLITPTRIPSGLDHDRAPARIGSAVVGRTDHPVGPVEVLVCVAVAVGVVAEGDHVGPGVEDVEGGLLGDAHAAGRVLAVDNDQLGREALAQTGHRARRGRAGRGFRRHRR